MIYVSILRSDGQHADFDPSGTDARYEARIESGTLLLYVRDGLQSVRIRLSEPLLSEIRGALGPVGT
jgi:hypothetical protein